MIELQLSLTIAAAITIFILAYRRTVKQYLKLFEEADSVINGKLKIGIFFSTIEIEGMYKGRKVICKLEQLKDAGDSILVKVKPYNTPDHGIFKRHVITDEVVFLNGWLVPRFFLAQKLYNKKVLKMLLDKISTECEKVEKGLDDGDPWATYKR